MTLPKAMSEMLNGAPGRVHLKRLLQAGLSESAADVATDSADAANVLMNAVVLELAAELPPTEPDGPAARRRSHPCPDLMSHPWNPRLPHGKGIDELSGARRPWTSRLELNIIDGVSLMRALPPWLARHHNAVDDFYFLQIL